MLSDIGYGGVELMTIEPGELNWGEIRTLSKKYHLLLFWYAPARCMGNWGFPLLTVIRAGSHQGRRESERDLRLCFLLRS